MASKELMKAFAVTLSEPKGMQDRQTAEDLMTLHGGGHQCLLAPQSSVVIKPRDIQYASGIHIAFLLDTVIYSLFILPRGKIVSDLLIR